MNIVLANFYYVVVAVRCRHIAIELGSFDKPAASRLDKQLPDRCSGTLEHSNTGSPGQEISENTYVLG